LRLGGDYIQRRKVLRLYRRFMRDSLLIKAAFSEKTERPPVWMMRQAGRFMKEYWDIKNKYSFLEMCKTPELAADVTMLPVDLLSIDAAILFSDI
jgi:uroporphyrinogen decarboxylase